MNPVLGREIVEAKEVLLVLNEAFACSGILSLVESDEAIICLQGILPGVGHIHVENVGRLVDPAPPARGGGELLFHGRPKSQATVSECHRQELLLAVFGGPNDHQDAGSLVVKSQVEVDAVGPDV